MRGAVAELKQWESFLESRKNNKRTLLTFPVWPILLSQHCFTLGLKRWNGNALWKPANANIQCWNGYGTCTLNCKVDETLKYWRFGLLFREQPFPRSVGRQRRHFRELRFHRLSLHSPCFQRHDLRMKREDWLAFNLLGVWDIGIPSFLVLSGPFPSLWCKREGWKGLFEEHSEPKNMHGWVLCASSSPTLSSSAKATMKYEICNRCEQRSFPRACQWHINIEAVESNLYLTLNRRMSRLTYQLF